ncbi:MAG TPA: antitoxin Xre/MbcA/ParS toxin-binding domain-containing protein [Opitutaceae bacterium]|nr:antitoxin Xre/MbcA/ParS toxin-binding domain-containing protein [Opitutaceae bacterium]
MANTGRMDYSADNPALVARVEEGVPVLDVVAFGREVGFTAEEMARLIQIPSRTYARRVAGKSRLKLDEGERAVRIMRLYDRALQALGSNVRARRWLNRPLRVLGGRTPLDFARTEPGAREVEAVLGRFEEGVYS